VDVLRLPILKGILPIDRSQIPADLVAGITLAALAIPEVMGYTKISGTPLVTGLYTILIPMVLYALFGSSRHLVVGADSATAAILAGSISGMAAPGSAQWLSLAGILALLTGGMLLLARLARLGFLADFLSRTVLVGFLTGVGIRVALGEVSGMLGLPEAGHGPLGKLFFDLKRIGEANLASLALSVAILAVLVGSRRLSGRIPGALIAIVGAIAVSWGFGLKRYGVGVIGSVPGGLPAVGLPGGSGDLSLIRTLVPTAFAMFIVILAQSAATSRAYASSRGEAFDENADLVGLCLANLGAGLSGTFVVNGSPTKTQMVVSAGGTSQLSQLTASLAVLLVLLFLTGPLAYLPTAALSTVVFLIGVELVDLRGMRRIFAERPWEFWVALCTAAVVVLVGVEQSILLAIVMSLVVHTRHGYLVNNMLLVPDGTSGWRQQKVSVPEQILPGLMIYRFMHNMYYANSSVLTGEVVRLVDGAKPPLSWFCIDAAAVNDLDFTAAESLRELHAMLEKKGVRLVFCEVMDEVAAEFDRSRLSDLLGRDAFFPSIVAVVSAFTGRSGDGRAKGGGGGP